MHVKMDYQWAQITKIVSVSSVLRLKRRSGLVIVKLQVDAIIVRKC